MIDRDQLRRRDKLRNNPHIQAIIRRALEEVLRQDKLRVKRWNGEYDND